MAVATADRSRIREQRDRSVPNGLDGRLTESGGSTDQRFDFVTFDTSEHSEITCEPAIVVWFALADGMPLEEEHSINVVSSAPAPAPINHVSYSESGSFRLTSMMPRT